MAMNLATQTVLSGEGAAAQSTPTPAPPTPEDIAKQFPNFDILACLGRGGMGVVYKARQKSLNRLVALKILAPEREKDAAFGQRFAVEAETLAKLNHPGIVTIYDFGQTDGLFYLVMEFVDGVNLRHLLEVRRISPREALAIVPQICDALQYAHDQGIVHRDIKPENILLDRQGRVKVADFGLAKLVGTDASVGQTFLSARAGDIPVASAEVTNAGLESPANRQAGKPTLQPVGLSDAGKVMGTPQYMAPEQRDHPTEVDHRADIYSLGVVFYQMLTGELPGKPIEPPSRKVQVDVRLDEVVLRALEKSPELRFQQVNEVKTLLETISTDIGKSEVRSQSPRPAQHSSSTANTCGEALARELQARDYVLDIGSCLRRGWVLVRGDSWPTVGVTTLILLLLHAGGFLFAGPLLGGLCLYFLKKIRGEPSSVETLFSGFRIAFMPLFLAGLVGTVACLLVISSIVIPIRLFSGGLLGALASSMGLVCLILPGVFLAGVTILTLVLVIDKRLDFRSAFKLSGAAVSRHWGKFLGFMFVLALINAAGIMAGVVGLLVTAPITLSAAIFAYEDIFASASRAGHPAAFAGDKTALASAPHTPTRLHAVRWLLGK